MMATSTALNIGRFLLSPFQVQLTGLGSVVDAKFAQHFSGVASHCGLAQLQLMRNAATGPALGQLRPYQALLFDKLDTPCDTEAS